MPCKSALLSIIQRQTEGVMYHDQMTDYYAFLHLDKLKELHHERTKEELCSLRKVKCDYIKVFKSVPFYTTNNPQQIPSDWRTKTTSSIDEVSLQTLLHKSLEDGLAWEQETCRIYKEAAKVFKENMNFYLYKEACKMIEETQNEIYELSEMLVEAASYSYNPSYFK
jgi:hypothetical protein